MSDDIDKATRPAAQPWLFNAWLFNAFEAPEGNVILIGRIPRKARVSGRAGRRRSKTAPPEARVVPIWRGVWESDPRRPWEPLPAPLSANITPFPRPLSQADYSEAERQFFDDLRDRGISLGRRQLQFGLLSDGSWPRADAVSKGRDGKDDAQYVFNLYDGWPRWTLINYVDGQGFRSNYYNKRGNLSAEERALVNAAIERNRQEAEQARERQERQWLEVAERCRKRWAEARPADTAHPYIVRKNVRAYGIRQEGENLLVPLIGADGLVWSLQTIPPEPGGRKMYAKGGRTRYGVFTIDAVNGETTTVYVCEGFATGATVAELTNSTVVVAFDSGKLQSAAERASRMWPTAKIVLCADDDWRTDGNPGLRAAREAAYAVGGLVALPSFEAGRSDKDTDFNDARRLRGDDDAVRAMLANATAPDPKDITDGLSEDNAPQYSEEALALAFAAEHKDNLKYVNRWGKWLQWDGRCWRSDETLSVISLVRKPCRAMATTIRTQSLARQVASIKTVSAVERLARSDSRLAATIELWDADPLLLGTPKGTVDLRTGELREAKREDYITKLTAVEPAEKADCPLWLKVLDHITGADAQEEERARDGRELRDFIQRIAGYVLTGITKEHAIFFNYGTGRNGKGTLMNTVAGILKDYHCSTPIETFTASNVDRHPTEMAGLQGARLVTAVETEDGRRWAQSRLTQVTGGDPISARFMRQDFFEYTPQFKPWISGNHKPGLRSVNEAIRSRMNMLPFTVTIPEDERDRDLHEKLKAEWGGILRWMIDGCLAWQRQKLSAPKFVKDTTAAYLASEDVLTAWREDECEDGDWDTVENLYTSYKAWAVKNEEYDGGKRWFRKRLEDNGFAPCKSGSSRGHRGLKVKPKPEPEGDEQGRLDIPF